MLWCLIQHLENTYIKNNLNDWVSTFSGAYTFVVLPAELPVTKFNAQLKAFAKKHKPAEYANDGYMRSLYLKYIMMTGLEI